MNLEGQLDVAIAPFRIVVPIADAAVVAALVVAVLVVDVVAVVFGAVAALLTSCLLTFFAGMLRSFLPDAPEMLKSCTLEAAPGRTRGTLFRPLLGTMVCSYFAQGPS